MKLGDDLEKFLAAATTEVLVVAPFIKRSTLQRLLAHVSSEVTLTVYTRWNAYEVAAGVSDLEVLDILTERGAPLLLVDGLHAKIYVADEAARVGSANVTHTALGWVPESNIEVLVDVARSDPHVIEAFDAIKNKARLATTEEATRVGEEAKLLKAALPPSVMKHVAPTEPLTQLEGWTPRSRLPEELYRSYRSISTLPETPLAELRADLAALRLPPGLSEEQFTHHVRIAVDAAGVPAAVIQELDRGGEVDEQRFAQMAIELERSDVPDRYTALLRWLRFLWPQRFLIEPDRYKIRQGHQIK